MKELICSIIMILLLTNYMQGQDEKSLESVKANLSIKINDGAQPDVYIDGIKYNAAIVDLLDSDKISSIDILKDEIAIKKYNAPNGVIVITTKKAYEKNTLEPDYKYEIKVRNREKDGNKHEPLIIIDGKVVVKSILNNLSPDDIEKIEVFKGEEAIKKYKAPNGVIVITTKS